MSLDSSELEWAARLSGQLKTLSEVAESLTYRMLELEERFAGQQRQLTSRQQASDQHHSDLAEAMEARMRDTEHRLVRLEDLLRNQERRPVSPPPLRAVPQAAARPLEGRLSEKLGNGEAIGSDLQPGETNVAALLPLSDDRFDPSLAS